MTPTDLTLRIQDIIRTLSRKEPKMPIHVRPLDTVGYEVCIEFRQYDPTCYSAELPDEQFMEFICRELKKNKSLRTEFMKAERNTVSRKHNDFISPYDTTRIDGQDR